MPPPPETAGSGTPALAAGSAPILTAAPGKIAFDDPHVHAGPAEAEVTRVRRLPEFWRWLLIGATAATIFLCINQQFTLRFFIGYTQLNTEYFYLLIGLMLPFTFLIFRPPTLRRSIACPGMTQPCSRRP